MHQHVDSRHRPLQQSGDLGNRQDRWEGQQARRLACVALTLPSGPRTSQAFEGHPADDAHPGTFHSALSAQLSGIEGMRTGSRGGFFHDGLKRLMTSPSVAHLRSPCEPYRCEGGSAQGATLPAGRDHDRAQPAHLLRCV